jgi:hypothetical protein
MGDRDIEDANWAADAVERMLIRCARVVAGELEAAAIFLRRWAR